MSQTATYLGSPVRWIAVNGCFAVCAVMATVGENRFALWVIVFLTSLYLLGGVLNIIVPGVLKEAAKRVKVSNLAMVLDLAYDMALCTLLCVCCEWYVWLMYLVAAAVISACELMAAHYLMQDVTESETLAKWAVLCCVKHYGEEYTGVTGQPLTMEVAARLHNGGPNGWRHKSTDKYWEKFSKGLAHASDQAANQP